MNASMAGVFESVDFKYRIPPKNRFLPAHSLVVAAEWDVRLEEPLKVKTRIDETLAPHARRPTAAGFPSCGSVFKNPREHGKSAWQVLDQLGLRGHRIGDAQISEKHSNFIVNLGSRRAADVKTPSSSSPKHVSFIGGRRCASKRK